MAVSGGMEVQQWYRQAVEALNRGDWQGAAQMADRLLPVAHQQADVQFIAGVAALGLKALRPAVAHLATAVRMAPGRSDYRAQLAKALAMAGNLRAAHETALVAVGQPVQDPVSANTLGVVLTQVNDHANAAGFFAQAAQARPDSATYRFNLATAATFSGDLPRARAEHEACLALEPRYWKSHLALAQISTQTEEENHLPRLRALLAEHGDNPEAVLHLELALSRELEDLGQHPQALEHLIAGKSVIARRRHYRWERDAALFEQLLQTFASGAVSAIPGHDSEEPIFVVGMPRSGTTLVERILSSHPQVHSAGELNNFPVAVRRACDVPTPALLDDKVLADTARIDWAAVGRSYVESTRPGTGHTPRFIDKLPHNFMYVGHILHALPRAKVVCLRRDGMDTCLGNFRQLFALESPHYDYAFDLLDTGHYFLAFERLMEGWASLFPNRILQLRYEDLVSDQEAVTRRLLAHCELPWDPACLAFHENRAASATASASQVREPLHARYQGRWRRYGPGLEPLRALLERGLPSG